MRHLECFGGPYDGRRVAYTGPEHVVPLASPISVTHPEVEILPVLRVGVYIRARVSRKTREGWEAPEMYFWLGER